jgi:hypothetical protein
MIEALLLVATCNAAVGLTALGDESALGAKRSMIS